MEMGLSRKLHGFSSLGPVGRILLRSGFVESMGSECGLREKIGNQGLATTRFDTAAGQVELLPGLNEEKIESLASRVAGSVPNEVKELLRRMTGFHCESNSKMILEFVDFTGDGVDLGMEELFPHLHGIAGDGSGNVLVADLQADSTEWGPIYYVSHDPPVVIFQSPNLKHCLQEVSKFLSGHPSSIEEVHEGKKFGIRPDDPFAIPHQTALESQDRVIREFAQLVGPGFVLHDLRGAEPGKGSAGLGPIVSG